jgi:heme exporter protein D
VPDLGKYAFSVLTSYGISFLLIGCLIAYILYRNYRIRIDLEKEDNS